MMISDMEGCVLPGKKTYCESGDIGMQDIWEWKESQRHQKFIGV